MMALEMSTVSVERLQPNPWNTNIVSPDNEKRIEESIKRLGLFKPILVRELDGGRLEILGGQHRWEVAKRMGHEEIPIINLGSISETKAKEIGLVDNGRYGEDDTLQLGALLSELGDVDDLSTFLPYNELDLKNIFDATSIALDDLALTDSQAPEQSLPASAPAPTHQVMRFKVPIEDIAWITALIETTMRKENFTSEDSLTNAGNAVVHLFNKLK